MKEKNILIISNLTCKNEIIFSLKKRFLQDYNSCKCNFSFYQYLNVLDEIDMIVDNYDIVIVFNSFVYENPNIIQKFLLDDINYEEIEKTAFDYYANLYSYLINRENKLIIGVLESNLNCLDSLLWKCRPVKSNFINKVNERLVQKFCKIEFIYLSNLIANIGIERSIQQGAIKKWGVVYKKELYEQLAEAFFSIYKGYMYGGPKCLVLDCDNVLWRGIVSEVGYNNLILADEGEGKAYKDFQRVVELLYKNGIIIALLSKNNENDVYNVFINHSEMVINWNMIASYRINWLPKIENIDKIAEELGIDLSSIVFMDDDIHEINTMKKGRPEVKSILFKPYEYEEILSLFKLPLHSNQHEISKRHETYQQNKKRNLLKAESISQEDYITSLETKVFIHRSYKDELARCNELLHRSHKCTIGNVYELYELKSMKNCDMYTVEVTDKFGSLGKVGFMGVKDNILIYFALSCRALGRNVQQTMIDFLKTRYSNLFVKIYDTGKNEYLAALFKSEIGDENVEFRKTF